MRSRRRSTLAGWVGAVSELVGPLVDETRNHVLTASKIHADDTPVPVLAPGNGKTKTGRLWTYVRDDKPAAQMTAPAVWFAYSEDRKGEHPRRHLKNYSGALQADAYSGRRHLYEGGRIYEVSCWAHARRKFDKSIPVSSSMAALSSWNLRVNSVQFHGRLFSLQSRILQVPAGLSASHSLLW